MADLRFSVLGPLQVRRGDTALAVGYPQQQAMLAALLLRPGRSAGGAELTEALWGEEPPGRAMSTVRTYAWRWRKALGADVAAPEVLVSCGDGYRLAVPDESIDALRAGELAAQAERAGAEGRSEHARRLLAEALALWQGVPLAGIPGPFAERQRRRLGELRIALLEQRLMYELDLGHSAQCVLELTELTAENPLRERPYALLMRALYQAGRAADALAVFRRARQVLVDELGVEPGADLTELHRRILQRDPALLPSPARTDRRVPAPAQDAGADAAPPGTPDPDGPQSVAGPERPAVLRSLPRPAQLPPSEPDFIGRERLVSAIGDALRETGRRTPAVVVLAGMGGVGKTALALHVAHRVRDAFPDGQLYADLHGGDDVPSAPEVVLATFLAALGVTAEALPEDLEARAALFRSMVDGRRLLIVLDSVRDTRQLRPLLPGAAGCAVLVTGRTRVAGLPVTVQADIDVFDSAEAVRLLGRAIGDERVRAEHAAALGLVEACGFLPLAVRIVGARLAARPQWSIASLNERLAVEWRRIDELRIGELTVEAVFELGYRQLSAQQALAFRLLAAADCADIGVAAAASMLAVDEATAEDLLETLVDTRMLASTVPGRYQYHDLLRSFARRKSAHEQPDEAVVARDRLLAFLLATACRAFQQAVPYDPIADAFGSPAAAVPGFADLAAAQAWVRAEADGARVLAAQVAAQPAAQSPAAQSDSTAGERLRHAIDLLIALSPFDLDTRYAELAATADVLVRASMASGDRRAEGRARFLRCTIALAATRLGEAETEARAAVAACREVGDTVILRQVLNDLGLIMQYLSRYDEAIHHFEEAIVLARHLGHRAGEVATTVNAALARVRGGRAAEAARMCRQVLDSPVYRQDEAGRAYAMYVLGLALHALGDYTEAVTWFGSCLTVAEHAGLRLRAAHARYRLADSLRAGGSPARALAHGERALAECEEIDAERDQGNALMVLGRILADLGRGSQARDRWQQAYALFSRLGLPDAAEAAALLEGRLEVPVEESA
ncbi:BTAD domain-containing putative transcriptional regulator [Streptomyces sp. NPDC048106]|uniref:AfsR/SARP family transcriptional regulator n=1 Tax=Streptomyces sp. NPDC048106 TaxID=3155750 RepID=UPI003454D4DD